MDKIIKPDTSHNKKHVIRTIKAEDRKLENYQYDLEEEREEGRLAKIKWDEQRAKLGRVKW